MRTVRQSRSALGSDRHPTPSWRWGWLGALLGPLGVLLTGAASIIDKRVDKNPRLWWLYVVLVAIAAVVTAIGVGLASPAWQERQEAKRQAKQARREQERRRGELLRFWPASVGRDVNPYALGVTHSTIAQKAARDDPDPYVARERDTELDQVMVDEQFVLVLGDSKAGKSRSAVEALRRCFPDQPVLVPAKRQALGDLLDPELDLKLDGAVLWLDRLERYLGEEGLTEPLLTRLLDAGVRVLATMRIIEHDRYSPKHDLQLPEWDVLQHARVVRYVRQLEGNELQRAREQFADVRLLKALERGLGLAEYLAAGPDLVHRFENASAVEPVGQAIVRTAVDWRRIGLTLSIPLKVLQALYPLYLADPDPVHRKSDRFQAGLKWAEEPIYATSSLLSRDNDGYLAFDYLLDYVEQERQYPVPDETWRALLAAASSSPAVTLQIGMAAWSKEHRDLAEMAFRQAAAFQAPGPSAIAATALGLISNKREQSEEAERWLRQAAEAGDHDASYNLGLLLRNQARVAEAEHWLRKADDKGNRKAAFDLGVLLAKQGQTEEAEAWYRKAAETGHAKAAHNLGVLLSERGRSEEAERWLRQAADAGDLAAANNLGVMLEERDPAEAEWLLRRVAEAHSSAHSPIAALNLGFWLARSGRTEEAEQWLRQAAQGGDNDAAYNLGVLLTRQGKREEAEAWYRKAEQAGNLDATLNLGVLLAERGQMEEAEHCWRRAAKAGNAQAALNLGVLLALRGEKVESEHWLRQADQAKNI